tara:strand:- start:603 stop:704 length:102 start_codon:yes stop_codon:yes gene_type:complete
MEDQNTQSLQDDEIKEEPKTQANSTNAQDQIQE